MDYGLSFVESGAQWRFPIALQIFFALSTIGLVSFLPETPRWLLNHDRIEEAVEVLRRMHDGEGEEVVERERLEIATAIAQERKARESMAGIRQLQPIRLQNGKGILANIYMQLFTYGVHKWRAAHLLPYHAWGGWDGHAAADWH